MNRRPFLVESWHSSTGRFHEKIFAYREGRRGRLLEEAAGERPPGRRGAALLRFYVADNMLHASGFVRTSESDRLPLIDPAGDPGTTLRALEARGALKVAGETQVGNNRGFRVISDPIDAAGGEVRLEYVVDGDTYLPLRQRWSVTRGSETVGFVTEFLVYERLPLNARTRAQLDLDPHPDAACAVGADQWRQRDLGFANPCARTGRQGTTPTP